MSQALTLPEKVIDLVGCSAAALEKAAEELDGVSTQKQACATLIPQVVDALIEHERITPDQREKAAQVLANPQDALELLMKVAAHRNTQEATHLGSGVGPDGQTKQASDGHDPTQSLSSPHVGARTTMVKQSDHNLFARLGLQPPTGS